MANGNVLEIPALFGSGVATPQVLPDRRQVMAAGGNNSLQVPGLSSIRQLFQSQGCCPCPPQGQSPFSPQGQPPGAVDGLGQPSTPQKPFQTIPQTPCEMVEEQLARQGLSTQMLQDCLKGGTKPAKRKPAKAKAKAKPKAKAAKTKRPARKKKAAPRVTASNGATYKLFANPRTGRSVCRNQRTNKFVKRSFCK